MKGGPLNNELTYEQWLAAVEAAETPPSDSLTTEEWSARLGIGRRRADEWIGKGMNNGWIGFSWSYRLNRVGVQRRVPTYHMIQKDDGAKESSRKRKQAAE